MPLCSLTKSLTPKPGSIVLFPTRLVSFYGAVLIDAVLGRTFDEGLFKITEPALGKLRFSLSILSLRFLLLYILESGEVVAFREL